MSNNRGVFVTFEGPDGCGKSTQARLAYERLARSGLPAVFSREPGGTRIGEAIRGLLLDPVNGEMSDRTEVLLYAASRAQHVAEVIRPALARGEVVILDRFVDSSLIYQGCLTGDPEMVRIVNEVAIAGLAPDLTILMDVESEVGLARVGRRHVPEDGRMAGADRIEQRQTEYHQRVRAAYLALAAQEPTRIKVVPTTGRSIDEVAHEVQGILAARWPEIFHL